MDRIGCRASLLVFLCSALLLLAAADAWAATVTGTPRDEVLVGTRYADSIRGKDGADILHGLDGADKIYGGYGRDKIYSGSGDDLVYVEDRRPRRPAPIDIVDCGAGVDTVQSDNNDRFRNCEMRVFASP